MQYTRNMVTGASTAELAVVLVDARNGVVEQTRRHAAVAALLRVPHVVLAVNKMDLVDYAEPVFAAIAEEFTAYAADAGRPRDHRDPDLRAGRRQRRGRRPRTWTGTAARPSWSTWRPCRSATTSAHCHARLPVQYVIRPQTAEHPDYRGYAGQIAAGALPRRRRRHRAAVRPHHAPIAGIDLLGTPVDAAWAPQSVTLLLADDLDISRGDLIAPSSDAPADHPGRRGDRLPRGRRARSPSATGCCSSTRTRTVKAIVKDIPSRLTLDDLSQHPHPGQLVANDIGRVKLRTAEPLPLDAYADSRRTGSFLLIDPADGTTLDRRHGRARRSPAPAAGQRTRGRRRRVGLLSMTPPTSSPRSRRRAAASAAAPSAAGQGGVARCAR